MDTSWLASLARPATTPPVTFRQSTSDADNDVVATVAAAYVQDQVELSRYVQLVGGLRADRFHVAYQDNRTPTRFGRTDALPSPRGGLVLKPVAALSVYGSYSVSHLPSAGDQFASLTVVTEQLKPERFTNYEVGIKWDVRRRLSISTASYRLDRTNTRATAPEDPTRIVQTGSQRTTGHELGISGRVTALWQVAGGYAYQNARVTSATAAARAGAQAAQVPRHTLSALDGSRSWSGSKGGEGRRGGRYGLFSARGAGTCLTLRHVPIASARGGLYQATILTERCDAGYRADIVSVLLMKRTAARGEAVPVTIGPSVGATRDHAERVAIARFKAWATQQSPPD